MMKKYNYDITSNFRNYIEGEGEIYIPDGTPSIKSYTFHSTNFTAIHIPISVKSIESSAFWYNKSLEFIYYEGTQYQWLTEVEKPKSWFSSDKNTIMIDKDGYPLI